MNSHVHESDSAVKERWYQLSYYLAVKDRTCHSQRPLRAHCKTGSVCTTHSGQDIRVLRRHSVWEIKNARYISSLSNWQPWGFHSFDKQLPLFSQNGNRKPGLPAVANVISIAVSEPRQYLNVSVKGVVIWKQRVLEVKLWELSIQHYRVYIK